MFIQHDFLVSEYFELLTLKTFKLGWYTYPIYLLRFRSSSIFLHLHRLFRFLQISNQLAVLTFFFDCSSYCFDRSQFSGSFWLNLDNFPKQASVTKLWLHVILFSRFPILLSRGTKINYDSWAIHRVRVKDNFLWCTVLHSKELNYTTI